MITKELKMEILKKYLKETQDYTEEDFLEYGEKWLEDVLIVDEEGREEEFRNYQYDLIEDLGLESFSEDFQSWILNNAIKNEWFDTWLEEYFIDYIEDIKYEEGRLEEEMKSANVNNEEDFLQYLIESVENPIEYLKFNFGDDYFYKLVINENLIDIERVIEEIANWDGYGCLAYYDGIEYEYCIDGELYFLYRQN